MLLLVMELMSMVVVCVVFGNVLRNLWVDLVVFCVVSVMIRDGCVVSVCMVVNVLC